MPLSYTHASEYRSPRSRDTLSPDLVHVPVAIASTLTSSKLWINVGRRCLTLNSINRLLTILATQGDHEGLRLVAPSPSKIDCGDVRDVPL